MTDASRPGAMVPVVHDPSRARSVCGVLVPLVNVTVVPALIRPRAGEIAHGFDQASSRFALRMLLTVSVPSLIVVTSSMRPSQLSAIGCAGGAGRSAIARLAPGYRMVLVLHDVEGFTHEEIGLQLGIAPGTSKAQLFKARRVMRALLNGREKT